MRFAIQAAAVLVLGSLLAAPAVALSGCWTGNSHASRQECMPCCPPLAKTSAAPVSSVAAQPLRPACCKVSPAKPAPLSQLSVPPIDSRIAPPTQVTAMPAPLAADLDRPLESSSPPLVPRSQSELCTFLI